jgi:hypothetical protein
MLSLDIRNKRSGNRRKEQYEFIHPNFQYRDLSRSTSRVILPKISSCGISPINSPREIYDSPREVRVRSIVLKKTK